MPGGKNNLPLRDTGDDVHHARHGGIAVHDEQHMVVSNRHRGVNLFASRRVVVPDDFLVRGYHADAELMREQNVAVRQHDGVADFAFPRGVVVRPHNLTVAHDEDAAVVRFAGVHEVVLGKSLAGKVRGNGRRGVRRGLSKTANSQCKRRKNESRSGHFHFLKSFVLQSELYVAAKHRRLEEAAQHDMDVMMALGTLNLVGFEMPQAFARKEPGTRKNRSNKWAGNICFSFLVPAILHASSGSLTSGQY